MRSAGSPEARTCDVDHLRPVTGGTYGSRCRRLRSPASSREVPAETQEGPAGTGRGWGHSGRIGVRGSGDLRRWSPRTGGSDLAAGRAGRGCGRPRPVGISDQARSVTVDGCRVPAMGGRLGSGPPSPPPPARRCGICGPARPGRGQSARPRRWELAHGVLVDAGPGPHGDRLPAGQLLAVDLPDPSATRSVPARAASSQGWGSGTAGRLRRRPAAGPARPRYRGRRCSGRRGDAGSGAAAALRADALKWA